MYLHSKKVGAQKQEKESNVLSGHDVGLWIKHFGVRIVGLEPGFTFFFFLPVNKLRFLISKQSNYC